MLYGYPCTEACLAIKKAGLTVPHFVHKENLAASGAELFGAMVGDGIDVNKVANFKTDVDSLELPEGGNVAPPRIRTVAGRRKKKRKVKGEQNRKGLGKVRKTCSLCGSFDHTKATCDASTDGQGHHMSKTDQNLERKGQTIQIFEIGLPGG